MSYIDKDVSGVPRVAALYQPSGCSAANWYPNFSGFRSLSVPAILTIVLTKPSDVLVSYSFFLDGSDAATAVGNIVTFGRILLNGGAQTNSVWVAEQTATAGGGGSLQATAASVAHSFVIPNLAAGTHTLELQVQVSWPNYTPAAGGEAEYDNIVASWVA